MEYRALICPHCQKENQVPAQLTSAVCSWCGERFDVPGEEPDENSTALFEKAVSLLDDELTQAGDTAQLFGKNIYPKTFEHYCAALFASLDIFDEVYITWPGDREKLVTDYAEEFGRRILAHHEQAKGIKDKENYVYLYVVFALPAVAEYGKSYSDFMADRLLETWNRAFPKRPLQRATYKQINDGFKRKFCYITTAVTQSLGMGDDCYELNAFRRFRDEYLAKTPDGELQIIEYYLTAPAVVQAIDASPRRDEVYREIWQRHLQKCLRLYEQGRPEACHTAYRAMMDELRVTFRN